MGFARSGRSISGKHCEIRYRDGGYWVHDVSTNGTFVNGAEYRLDAPHRFKDGDRLGIGPYIIAVAVEEGRKLEQHGLGCPASVVEASVGDGGNVWGPIGEAAAPNSAPTVGQRGQASRLPTFWILLRSSRRRNWGRMDLPARTVRGRLADRGEARLPASSAGSRRSRASNTRADAAGDRRPAVQTAFAQGATSGGGPARRKSWIASLGQRAFPLAFFRLAILRNWRMKSARFFG